ncbi:MAG: hypothetical protein PHO53_04365 [Actinomycetota bacterium]|nr:hypothetical protein [Actinomycetota bacterium]
MARKKKFSAGRVLVSLIVALSMLLVTGCGAPVEEAKEYMKKGDDLSVRLKSYTDEAKYDAVAIAAQFGVQLAATGEVDYKTAAAEGKNQISKLIRDGRKAKEEYEKILELKDVEDYKNYAELRIKAIDSSIATLEGVSDLLTEIEETTDKPADVAEAWLKENPKVIGELAKSVAYWTEAEVTKRKKNLEGTEQ